MSAPDPTHPYAFAAPELDRASETREHDHVLHAAWKAADTRVIVDNGETAVIGGLIRTNTGTIRRGVPILKDIPILGYIFSGTSEVKEKRELLIFITPKIVTNWSQTG